MSHDVFISHSSLDKPAADAVCHGLEAKGVRCWIAPRDQVAGQPYGEQITAAIQAAQVMVLIFSDNVNKSHAVHNEVDLAAAANLTIVPFRLSAVDFNPELRFYLGRVHWLDAFPKSVDNYIDELAATVRRNLRPAASPAEPSASASATASTPSPVEPAPAATDARPKPPPARRPANNRALVLGAIAAGVVVVAGLALALTLMRPRAGAPIPTSGMAASSGESAAPASSSAGSSSAPAAAGSSGADQVRYFETVVVPGGPPATLDGATLITTAELKQILNNQAQGAHPFALLDARGCTGEPTISGAECLAPNSINEFKARFPNKALRIVIFGDDGRSGRAYALAAGVIAAGYGDIAWYRGGLNAWKAAALPTGIAAAVPVVALNPPGPSAQQGQAAARRPPPPVLRRFAPLRPIFRRGPRPGVRRFGGRL